MAEQAVRLTMAASEAVDRGRNDLREILDRTYRIVFPVRDEDAVVLSVFEGPRLFSEG